MFILVKVYLISILTLSILLFRSIGVSSVFKEFRVFRNYYFPFFTLVNLIYFNYSVIFSLFRSLLPSSIYVIYTIPEYKSHKFTEDVCLLVRFFIRSFVYWVVFLPVCYTYPHSVFSYRFTALLIMTNFLMGLYHRILSFVNIIV